MSSILKGIKQLNEVNPHNYDSDWDYQDAVANSGRSRSRYSSSYDALDDENDAYEMHKRFAATRARKEAEAKAAAEKAKTGEQGVSESVNYKADAEKLKRQGDMTGYHRTMVRHYDALADNATHRGDAQRYQALANKHHAASKGITEADEWEEETGKHQRFVEYAKKTLMSERDPKRRIETANYLSKQENKFFGSPISSAAEQTQFGSVNTGKAFTDLIKGIMSDIQDGRLHYEQDALNAAIWLEPEGKEFLQKAHTDFIDMMDHSRKEREQHAIALSGYQTKNLGGKVMGAPLKGGIVNDASARMTPEIFGVFELAEQEILRKKGEREDEQERQRNIAIWNALPGPLKLAAAAAVGKTPDQLEKILFAKSEIDAVAGLDASDFPNLAGSAKPTNNSVAEDMDGTEYIPKVGDEVLWRHSDPRSKMMPMPGTVLAVAPGKVKLKIYSKRMIQNRGTDTVVLNLANYILQPKPGVAGEQLDELSTNTLASYKKKAGADATSADKRGDYARGNKRMSGIMQATKKEFANDAKGVAEGSKVKKGSMITETRTYKLWENAGQKIAEAQLTQDQINQIFGYVEKIQTAGGGNRTMLGKGKDAAGAVGKAWEELKTKVQNSGPVKGFDAMYDKAAEQLKQATGGDQGVMQYVQKYRDFAKKHPVAQSLIYATLIAAAGISGAGVGGAAALGLFKMADKLLQGEKFSSAAYQGAKTGGMAYAAGQIGQAMKGGETPASTSTSTATTTAPGITGDMSYDQAFNTYIQKFAQDPKNPSAMIVQQAKQFAATKANVNESIELTESQLYLMMGKIVERQHKLDEGIMDTVKGAAGKAMNWAQTKGTNLTTKITADKLLQAWKKAGSPMDSLDVASIVQQAGVPSDTIKQVYGNMKIPFAGEPGANTATRNIQVDPSSVAPPDSAPAQAASPGADATAPGSVQQVQTTYAQVKKLIDQLDKKGKQRVVTALKKSLGLAVAEGSMGAAVSQPPGSTVSAGQRFYKPRHVPNQDELQKQDEKELDEEKQRLDPSCWKGYRKQGTKMKGNTRVNNCVPIKESSIMQGVKQLDEGWKEKLSAAALAGSMALGAAGAHARVTPDGQGGFTGGLKPTATVTAPSDDKPATEAPKGFSQEYLQKAANPDRVGRYLISVEKAQELLKQGQGQ